MRYVNEKQLQKLPLDKKSYHKDESMPNLYFHISPKQKGTGRSFVFRYRWQGKLKEKVLGKYPAISLAEARAKANEYNLEILKGENPFSFKPSNMKLKEIYDLWFETAKQNRKNTDFARPLEKHIIEKLADTPIDKLKKQDILLCLDRLHEQGKRETIKRIIIYLNKMLEFARAREFIDFSIEINPSIIYGKHIKQNFRSITNLSRFRDLLIAIDEYRGNGFTKDALMISPYLFLRAFNIRNLEWSEIDFENKQIVISGRKIKGGDEFIVPLATTPLRILKEVEKYKYGNRFVFPSDITSFKAMSESTLNQAIKRMGFGDEMVYHGFRASASTFLYEYQHKHGFSSEVIELCLDHRERNSTKAAYNRSKMLEQRIALMQWWSNFIDNLKMGNETKSS